MILADTFEVVLGCNQAMLEFSSISSYCKRFFHKTFNEWEARAPELIREVKITVTNAL